MSLAQPPIPPPARPSPAPPDDLIYPLTVRQYHEMIRAGILTDDDPLELLEGHLVVKTPKYPRHSTATKMAERAADRLFADGWHVRVQEPITLADSEPEPDVAVVRGGVDRYVDRHPGAKDIALVIEVADATLVRDRGAKMRAYASAKIPIYWIVNLVEQQVEAYSRLTGPGGTAGYRSRQNYGLTGEVPLTVRGRELGRVRVTKLIPARGTGRGVAGGGRAGGR